MVKNLLAGRPHTLQISHFDYDYDDYDWFNWKNSNVLI